MYKIYEMKLTFTIGVPLNISAGIDVQLPMLAVVNDEQSLNACVPINWIPPGREIVVKLGQPIANPDGISLQFNGKVIVDIYAPKNCPGLTIKSDNFTDVKPLQFEKQSFPRTLTLFGIFTSYVLLGFI